MPNQGPTFLQIATAWFLVALLIWAVRRWPNQRWAILLRAVVGPPYPAIGVLRGDTLRGARWYAVAALVCFFTVIGLWWLGATITPADPLQLQPLAALWFMFVILVLLALAAMVILLLKAIWLPWYRSQEPDSTFPDGDAAP